MKQEYKGLPVKQWTFEDWINGERHFIVSGKIMIDNAEPEKRYYLYLSEDDYIKIYDHLKNSFSVRSERYFKLTKQYFEESKSRSKEPEIYHQKYIEGLEKKVLNHKLYHKQIILGEIEYTKLLEPETEAIRINEIPQIELDVWYKFLKELQKTPKPTTGKSKKKEMASFKLHLKPNRELKEVYQWMIDEDNNMIAEKNYEQFEAIFTGQSIEKIKPIKWIASNRLLAYFLDNAFSGDWPNIAGSGKLFINKRNKLLTANDLSAAKSDYSKYGQPKGCEKIDRLLIIIQKH